MGFFSWSKKAAAVAASEAPAASVRAAKLINRVNEAEQRHAECQRKLDAAVAKIAELEAEIEELEEEAQHPTALEDWQLQDLAEAARALEAGRGGREARDRIERVLENVDPGWRTYA